jgi:hypothetical protein
MEGNINTYLQKHRGYYYSDKERLLLGELSPYLRADTPVVSSLPTLSNDP